MKKNKMSKKILVLVLCFVMLFSQSLLVMANEGTKDPSADTTIEEVVEEATDVVEEETTEVVEEETTEVVEEETTEVEEETTEVVEETTEVVEETTEVVEETTEVVEETTEVVEETTEVVEEITVFNYESEEVNVVVTLTDPADLPVGAELVVEPIILEEDIITDIINVAYDEDQAVVQNIYAYDIKFMINGEEVQPGDTVKVSVTVPNMKKESGALVYHVDEDNNIENMESTVVEEGTVEFETPHFSYYVVTETDEINEASEFTGYGLLTSGRSVSNGVLEYNKTAKVDDWDERTYDIEITAKSILEKRTISLSDGMLVIDMSGSMRYEKGDSADSADGAEFVRIGKYNSVVSSLDTNKLYIINGSGNSSANISNETYLYTLAYLNESENPGWYYYAAGAKENDTTTATIPGNYNSSLWKPVTGTAANWYVFNWDEARLNQMKEVVMKYMNTVAEESPLSYLGISTFYSKGNLVHEYDTISNGSSIDLEVLKEFLAMRAQKGWCTYPNLGLEIAFKEMVSSSAYYDSSTKEVIIPENSENSCYQRTVYGSKVDQYVVLFSDGYPDSSGDDSKEVPKIKAEAEAWAKAFREANINVYTVAFQTSTKNKTWLKDNIASSGCNYETDSQDGLEGIFSLIKQQEETTAVDYVTVDVKDYVDDRFVILDENGVQITEDYPGIANGVQITTSGKDGDTTVTRTGTVYYDNEGRQYIVWEDQKAMKEGSTWTIKVQAREDYIGGNDVTTNIDGISVIDAGDYGEFDLPNPTVNVKATMSVGNNNLYIYKGTAAPTEADSPTDPVSMLYNANVAINNYLAPGYAGVGRDDFTLAWYTDAACTQAVSLDTMAATGLDAEKNYYLKFTYNPGESTDDSDANTTKNGTTYIAGRSGDDNGKDDSLVEATNVDDATKNYGIYNIKLWQIVKRDNSGSQQPLANVEFTIANNGTTYYGKSDANGFVTLYTDAAFTTKALDTPIGTFTLTETKAPEGYMISDETWTIVGSYSNNQGADVTSSTGNAVAKETPDGVVASYIYYNVAAHSLPNTGGAGTAAFTGAGAAILIGAAWLTFVMARRRKQEI